MTKTVNIHEAKTHLSRLLERVGEGGDRDSQSWQAGGTAGSGGK